jgi:hypothetical protein
MFFKTLSQQTRKTLFNIRLQVFGLFFITRPTPRAWNFGLIPEKWSDNAAHMKIPISAVTGQILQIWFGVDSSFSQKNWIFLGHDSLSNPLDFFRSVADPEDNKTSR